MNASEFLCGITTIHPFSIPTSSIQGCRGAGAPLKSSTVERRGIPWTGCQSALGEHANSMQKDTWPGVKPRTFKLQPINPIMSHSSLMSTEINFRMNHRRCKSVHA
ncbi:hypothetical protein CHARACLAT_016373 [Characodon lateralis]|uniref:Uncharacterized protein n=1 Tax=Characodon lateralis TaxID=208331 RepID=A0ABU7DJB6_9TELE|nr:hypothetical protein [Characodon lateralis]